MQTERVEDDPEYEEMIGPAKIGRGRDRDQNTRSLGRARRLLLERKKKLGATPEEERHLDRVTRAFITTVTVGLSRVPDAVRDILATLLEDLIEQVKDGSLSTPGGNTFDVNAAIERAGSRRGIKPEVIAKIPTLLRERLGMVALAV